MICWKPTTWPKFMICFFFLAKKFFTRLRGSKFSSLFLQQATLSVKSKKNCIEKSETGLIIASMRLRDDTRQSFYDVFILS